MSETCCDGGSNVMILACSGGSNVGRLSNEAAVELTREGFGKMFCLAGIGGHFSGFVQSAKDVPRMVAIDGCPVGCVKAILSHAEIPLKNYVVITDLGIEKNKNLSLERADIDLVKDAVKTATAPAAVPASQIPPSVGCACTCGGPGILANQRR
ncbi:putative zinc-binding protein [Desulfococcus sp.]|uniref:putative zinc-binding protein n=1 Tax=Desulfococcus sp. TaxID=2025834 RepID=UPI003593260F